MHHNTLMVSKVHDALAYCRYEYDRCAHTVNVSKSLRETLSQRLTLLVLQRSKNIRIRRKMIEDREKLAQQHRIFLHGRSARYIV